MLAKWPIKWAQGHFVLALVFALTNSPAKLQAEAASAWAFSCTGTLPRIVGSYVAGEPATGIGPIRNMEMANCLQDGFVRQLEKTMGPVVGYKVGLTSAAVQELFGVDRPLSGRLLRRMVLPNGVTVPHDYGALPMVEADIIVKVADEAINKATTALEVAAHIESAFPFIELGDRVVGIGEPLSAEVIVAVNLGARFGVLGTEHVVSDAAGFVDALAAISVSLEDENGARLVEAQGGAILGHPLNAVLALLEDLKARGWRLRAGDMISLGAFAPPIEPKPDQQLTLSFEGLPGGTLVAVVRFR